MAGQRTGITQSLRLLACEILGARCDPAIGSATGASVGSRYEYGKRALTVRARPHRIRTSSSRQGPEGVAGQHLWCRAALGHGPKHGLSADAEVRSATIHLRGLKASVPPTIAECSIVSRCP